MRIAQHKIRLMRVAASTGTGMQGYLAYKKRPPSRTTKGPQACAHCRGPGHGLFGSEVTL